MNPYTRNQPRYACRKGHKERKMLSTPCLPPAGMGVLLALSLLLAVASCHRHRRLACTNGCKPACTDGAQPACADGTAPTGNQVVSSNLPLERLRGIGRGGRGRGGRRGGRGGRGRFGRSPRGCADGSRPSCTDGGLANTCADGSTPAR